MRKTRVLVFSCLSVLVAYSKIRDSLGPAEQESGIVTKKEMEISDAWFNTIVVPNRQREPWLDKWVSTALPFSFQYNGMDSGALLTKWKLEESDNSGTHELSWTDSSTDLHTVCHILKSPDYPTV